MAKGKKREKITNETILKKMNFDFSRNAEWFKRTTKKIDEIKEELSKNFYSEQKKKEKLDFMQKLKAKLKDYRDAIKFEATYKKVRFVERRKLERKLNHINKEIQKEKNQDKLSELNKEKNKIVSDINYVKFYPKTFKYYALFPKQDKDNQEMIAKREKMRKKIEYFLNQKKNKEGEDEEDNSENKKEETKEDMVDDENIDVDIKSMDDNDDEEDNIHAKEEIEDEENSTEIKELPTKQKNKQKNDKDKKVGEEEKQKKKTKNEEIPKHNSNYELEGRKKKKPFKDDFFVLDE